MNEINRGFAEYPEAGTQRASKKSIHTLTENNRTNSPIQLKRHALTEAAAARGSVAIIEVPALLE
jgi:hypothetical protein